MTDTATKPKAKPAKLGAEKLTPEEQRRRFEELALEAGCTDDEEPLKAAVRAMGNVKPKALCSSRTSP